MFVGWLSNTPGVPISTVLDNPSGSVVQLTMPLGGVEVEATYATPSTGPTAIVLDTPADGSGHGTGGLWMAMGGGAVSGAVYGLWPTLNPAQIDRSNETAGGITYVRSNTLPFSMDVRDIFGQVMVSHLGATATDLGVMFPGHTPTTDPNLFFITGA